MALSFVFGLHELLYIIVTFFALLMSLYYFAFKYWKNKGVPCMATYSIFGHMNDYIFQKESAFETITRQYKIFNNEPFFGMYFGWKPVLVIRNPEILKCVMIKDFINFHDRLETVNEKTNPLDANLIFLKGEKWRLLRTKLTPAFTSGKIKNMFGIMRECAKELNLKLSDLTIKQQDIEVKKMLCKFTIDIISSCGFGLERESFKNLKPFFREVGDNILAISFVRTIKRVAIFSSPFISKLFGISVFDQTNSDTFIKIVKDIVEYREENNHVRNDFLQLLIEIKNKGQIAKDKTVYEEDEYENTHLQFYEEENIKTIKLSDSLIAAQCLAFFLGGFETSSSTMSYCLYELALNPQIQDKVRREVNTVINKYGDLTYDAIQDMEYLSSVIDETLRKYPVIPVVFRSCINPYTIPGTNVTIDHKVSVFIPIYAIHHDPKYYPDPEMFDPERFTKDAKRSRQHFTYLPFGEGPRMCIGMRFGLLETKLGVASLISKYEFSACEQTDIPLKIDPGSRIAISILNGIWLRISPLSYT